MARAVNGMGGGMSAARSRARLAAAATAATFDALAHRFGRPPARTAVRFGTAMAVLGIARAAGVSWAELGLGRRELGRGARTGAAAGACAAAAVLAGAAVPVTRRFFLDDRAAAAAGRGGLAAGLARITLIAVPPEELTYRSALLGLWLGNGSPASAVARSSALFGLSHILPTRSTMGQTALGQHLERRPLRQAAFVAGNVAVTGAAGAVFAWLRLRSGSVLAPLLAHAALNDAALVAGRAAHRLGRYGDQPPG
jgi:membrane protease YdiL (CAAX protease family)